MHHGIIRSMPLVLGSGRETTADYLDACRERRDRLRAEHLTAADADALLEIARELSLEVGAWLAQRHPGLVPA